MTDSSNDNIIPAVLEEKKRIRREMKQTLAAAVRTKYSNSDRIAALLAGQLFALPEVQNSSAIMTYLNLPNEVPTLPLVGELFSRRDSFGGITGPFRQVAVPWCNGKELELFLLAPPLPCEQERDRYLMRDVTAGAYGIFEPRPELRLLADRQLSPEKLDVVLVPGLAFSRRGARLGRGAGYYDRFLARLSDCSVLIGLAFEEQILPTVPMESHDRFMNYIILPGQTISTGISATY